LIASLNFSCDILSHPFGLVRRLIVNLIEDLTVAWKEEDFIKNNRTD
jgi:hypothetical protein